MEILKSLVTDLFQETPIEITKLPQSGSPRVYYRISFHDRQPVIGVYNSDVKENEAFFGFTESFKSNKIAVPEIYFIAPDRQYYIIEDLGDVILFEFLKQDRTPDGLGEATIEWYKKVLEELPKIQLLNEQDIDFSLCYPRAAFDRQSMNWDLNYFKYYYLKLVHAPFDEQELEDDFNKLIQFLSEADAQYFMFRDFQSRNVMLHQDKPYFIDYQGGRRGPLQYDLASLLYDGKADIPESTREELYYYYIDQLARYIEVDKAEFETHYIGFVLIRIMQALGAYGYRGYYEKKSHFLQSIPYALRNIRYILRNKTLPISIPTLWNLLDFISKEENVPLSSEQSKHLTITIQSFSFKVGIPTSESSHGGGFVFDCRFLPNPGRVPEYREYNGTDYCVQEYLSQYDVVEQFKKSVEEIVVMAVDNYIEREFQQLMINFGCTGGQHRSVYFAEWLTKTLQEKFPQIQINLNHIQFPKLSKRFVPKE